MRKYFSFIKQYLNPPIHAPQAEPAKPIIYAHYDDALSDCSVAAYQNDLLVQVIAEKTKLLVQQSDKPLSQVLVQTLTAILMAQPKEKRPWQVVDFGGACGATYLQLKAYLPPDIRWMVVETPSMVKAATSLSNQNLSFFDNLSDIAQQTQNIDLLFVSGTLQSVDKPGYYLEQLLDLGAKHIFFSRLGLTALEKNITIVHRSQLSDNGVGVLPEQFKDQVIAYPLTYMPENLFQQKINPGYIPTIYFEDRSGLVSIPGVDLIGYAIFLTKRQTQ
ncbi:MAG: methyltransferase, TIGR04325 family [Bernardetiaceae bacterium]